MLSTNPIISNFLWSCQYNVKVPVAQSAVPAATSVVTEAALNEAIDGGFPLEWNANNNLCDTCQKSTGQCGTNESTSAFVCYCSDGTSSSSTCGGSAAQGGIKGDATKAEHLLGKKLLTLTKLFTLESDILQEPLMAV
ncbi:hypothetical protein CJ030_MR6G021576 [Morella rubra]|uniref:Wall-associated receptor kinase C-terminal domain-containing protein n=1 Tax=Morella rubra TaxID=262757 RepID=A0A6A1VET1_9ROSI|nr:hypothetical protein CJ030_MR6G021576 [Morella rubra]